jgi:processive 1,2-diacylglycerol beta-glucosyltransferase
MNRTAPGIEVTEVDFLEEFLPGVAVLARFAYAQDASFFPVSSGDLASAMSRSPGNAVLEALNGDGLDSLQRFLKAGSFDLVLATSEVGAAAAAEIAADIRPPVAAVVTTFSAGSAWVHPDCDLYFVATKEVREDLVMTGVPYSRVVVSGVPSRVPERADSRSELRRRAGLAERFTVALGLAGYAHADTRAIAVALSDLGIQVVVEQGQDSRADRHVRALAATGGLVRVADPGLHESPVLMADMAMGRAGGTMLLEAVCAGVPSVIYNPVASRETANVDFLLNTGASLLARDDDDAVAKSRFLSNHPDRLNQMSVSAKGVGTYNSTRLVVDRLAAFIR